MIIIELVIGLIHDLLLSREHLDASILTLPLGDPERDLLVEMWMNRWQIRNAEHWQRETSVLIAGLLCEPFTVTPPLWTLVALDWKI